MKTVIEQTGKSLEEAIRKGLDELKVSREDVIVEVLEEGTTGFLNAKPAKVRLIVNKKVTAEVLDRTKVKVDEFIKGLIEISKDNIEYKISEENNFVLVEITGEDAPNLVGYKGIILSDIQTLINAFLSKEEDDYAKVSVDINGYKKNKAEILKKLARKMAENVVRFKKIIKLEPMSAYERKIIHAELQNHEKVETESIGEEPRRRVIIRLKK
ncbi:MAG: RNA-binding cell elongation regulator Jag/EloR [Clostridia bacterium]